MKKTHAACQLSISAFPEALYLWTFTFAEVLDIPVATMRWKRLVTDPDGLTNAFPSLKGIRVFEMHPGKEGLSHGLHIHMVCAVYMSVDVVRAISTKKGFGRIHVKKIDREKALYVAKYLSKNREECLKGMRLWAPVGNYENVKVKNIVVNSDFNAAYYFLAGTVKGFQSLSWNQRIYIVARFSSGCSIEQALEMAGLRQVYYEEIQDPWEALKEEFDTPYCEDVPDWGEA